MIVTFLGTGTSQGVPVIGCDCGVCRSADVRDRRLRCSILLSFKDVNVVVDVGPDFRQQMLREEVKHLDAVLITHEHNDHVVGMDDIRPFNFRQRLDMPVYALDRVLREIKAKFFYIFDANPYPGSPRVVCHPIFPGQPFSLSKGIQIMPIEVIHGNLPILGFRVGNFAYITDASAIGPESTELLRGLDILVLNALQYRKHYSHFTFDEAVEVAAGIGASKTYFTHMSHEMGLHRDMESGWPQGILPAYDGLKLTV